MYHIIQHKRDEISQTFLNRVTYLHNKNSNNILLGAYTIVTSIDRPRRFEYRSVDYVKPKKN